MDEIVFTAPEYQQDRSIIQVQYRYSGSPDTGWRIQREGQDWLELGVGYVPVKTAYCGICSTDLARHLLPFPLPQITGHEVIGEYRGKWVAIEINASHLARGVTGYDCDYCQHGLDTHCPDRLTLGIDRLPGGFSPWVLAPRHAIHALPESISPHAGVLIEPFAAAVRAVEMTPPVEGDRIAVLGPRRLGMLLIAALDSYRKIHQLSFELSAVMRHTKLQQTALQLGADQVVLLEGKGPDELAGQYDTVFDTTGSPAGFASAMLMAKKTVHLKSTHGQRVLGFDNMTTMVINEQQLQACTEQNLRQLTTCRPDSGQGHIFVSPGLLERVGHLLADSSFEIVSKIDDGPGDQKPCQPFEFALVGSMQELNALTRARTPQGQSLLKATGKILFDAVTGDGSDLIDKLGQQQIQLVTSRCGSFARTLELFKQLPELAENLEKNLITQTLDSTQLEEAMRLASQSDKSIKVVVKTN